MHALYRFRLSRAAVAAVLAAVLAIAATLVFASGLSDLGSARGPASASSAQLSPAVLHSLGSRPHLSADLFTLSASPLTTGPFGANPLATGHRTSLSPSRARRARWPLERRREEQATRGGPDTDRHPDGRACRGVGGAREIHRAYRRLAPPAPSRVSNLGGSSSHDLEDPPRSLRLGATTRTAGNRARRGISYASNAAQRQISRY